MIYLYTYFDVFDITKRFCQVSRRIGKAPYTRNELLRTDNPLEAFSHICNFINDADSTQHMLLANPEVLLPECFEEQIAWVILRKYKSSIVGGDRDIHIITDSVNILNWFRVYVYHEILSDSEVVVIHDETKLEMYDNGNISCWPKNLFSARDKVIKSLSDFSFDPDETTESPVKVMYSSGEEEVIVVPELTYESISGMIGAGVRPYGIILLDTIEDGVFLAADEYGEIRATQYNENASELALEEVHGTAVQLMTEQVEKVRGERPLQ
jgi:hypothetical protein